MNSGSHAKLWILVPVWLLAFGCAKVDAPTGGPKDREMPIVLKSVPENGALNFTGNEIMITFNEYVVLDKISDKFMVSPPMKKRPEIIVRGKSIRISYEDELRDSTTYTLYFQDAVRDLNEGNPIPNYQFVFSTGNFIDSLSVTGNVYSGFTLDPPDNTLIMLYSDLADTSVRSQIPAYITRSAANGEFRIDNVHQGTYRLYALTDADNSKNYNNADEWFAFYDNPVEVNPGKNYLPLPAKKDTIMPAPVAGTKTPFVPPVIGEHQLVLFQAEKKLHYLTSSSRKLAQQLVYTLSLPPDSLGFIFSVPGADESQYFTEWSRGRDTISVWLTDSTLYNRGEIETHIWFPFTDTLGITALKADTVPLRFAAPRAAAARGRALKPVPYKVKANISGQVRPDAKIFFTAPTPFQPPDTSRIIFYEVLKDSRIRHRYRFVPDSTASCRYRLDTEIFPGKNYMLITDSAAFRSIYGESSDSTAIKFTIANPESYGQLTLKLSGYEGNIIVQILDDAEKLVRQAYLKGNGTAVFPLLDKGKYRMRAVFDLNNDGKWTTGDFDSDRQPEPVVFYKEEINIPENWQIEQPWELVIGNYKEPKLQKVKSQTR